MVNEILYLRLFFKVQRRLTILPIDNFVNSSQIYYLANTTYNIDMKKPASHIANNIPPKPIKTSSKTSLDLLLLYLVMPILLVIIISGIYINTEERIAPGSVLYSTKINLETLESMASQTNNVFLLNIKANIIEKRLLEMSVLSKALNENQADFIAFQYGNSSEINENINILIIKTQAQIELLDNEVRHLPLNTGDSSDDNYNEIREIVNELSSTRKNILRQVLENGGANLDEKIANQIRDEVEINIEKTTASPEQIKAILPQNNGPIVPDN